MGFGRFPSAELMLTVLALKRIIQGIFILQRFDMLDINLLLVGEVVLLLEDSRRHFDSSYSSIPEWRR